MRSQPASVAVLSRSSTTKSSSLYFLFAESILSGAHIQPHVQNLTISVANGKNTIIFQMFYKRHFFLPINYAIPLLESAEVSQVRFRGDVLIMRVSASGERAVNMRTGDSMIADRAVQRYAPVHTYLFCRS